MLKIIIPIAGSSELFINSGFHYPKPLIEVNGKPMIELVLQNPIHISKEVQFIFMLKEEDCFKYHLDNTLKLLVEKCVIVKIKKNTKGALITVLMAIDKLEKEDELLILNSDQVIDADFNHLLNSFRSMKVDAGIITFTSVHPRWSYARVENGNIVETAEKNPISNHAIAGFYYFKKASDFLSASFQSIQSDASLDGNFFISPVINQFILSNKNVRNIEIPSDSYHSFYSPQKVEEYERKNT